MTESYFKNGVGALQNESGVAMLLPLNERMDPAQPGRLIPQDETKEKQSHEVVEIRIMT